MGRTGRADRGIRAVALSLALAFVPALVAGCGGSGSGSGPGSWSDGATGGGGQQETAGELSDVAGIDVAAGEGRGWLLIDGDPDEIWEVGSDGTLTRRGELADGGSQIAAFGDGVAVARFVCTDSEDEECGAPVADLFLVDEHGTVDHEVRVTESDGNSLEGVGMTVVGTSDEHVWVEVATDDIELFAVSRAGEVESVPLERRRFAADEPCVVGGELLMVRVHTDLYDPELGPPPGTGVAMSAETPIRTTVALEAYADGRWAPVEGSERTVELRGDEAHAVCGPSSVGIVDPRTATPGVDRSLARWTRDGGWVEAPTGPEPPAPPLGSVSVDGCLDCAWGADGEILHRGEDGTFQATGLVVATPAGTGAATGGAPNLTQVDIGADGTMVACARFPADGPGASTAPTAPPPTATVPALMAPRRSPDPGDRATGPGAGLPASQPEASTLVCDLAPA